MEEEPSEMIRFFIPVMKNETTIVKYIYNLVKVYEFLYLLLSAFGYSIGYWFPTETCVYARMCLLLACLWLSEKCLLCEAVLSQERQLLCMYLRPY